MRLHLKLDTHIINSKFKTATCIKSQCQKQQIQVLKAWKWEARGNWVLIKPDIDTNCLGHEVLLYRGPGQFSKSALQWQVHYCVGTYVVHYPLSSVHYGRDSYGGEADKEIIFYSHKILLN